MSRSHCSRALTSAAFSANMAVFSHLNLNHLFDSRTALAPTHNTPRFSVLDDWDRHRCSGRGTLDRLRKDSFWWYQRCIATNGADLG